jgi:hypothetical protein
VLLRLHSYLWDPEHDPEQRSVISMRSGVAILTMSALSTKLDGIAPFISPKLSESLQSQTDERFFVHKKLCNHLYHVVGWIEGVAVSIKN